MNEVIVMKKEDVERALQEAVRRGWMKEVAPGRFQLTAEGKARVERGFGSEGFA